MMNQRFSLFHAGYAAYIPSLYYQQVSLANSHLTAEDPRVREYFTSFAESLKQDHVSNHENLSRAIEIATDLKLPVDPCPQDDEAYPQWVTTFTEVFEQEFPMGKIHHYYFLYSRKVAEIIANLGLARCYIRMSGDLEGTVDFSARIEKALKDTEYILFKMIASAALLSSEPRHSYFNQFYKQINEAFIPYRNLEVRNLSVADLDKLSAELGEYQEQVKKGYEQALALLRELGV